MATFDVLLPVKNGLPFLCAAIGSIQQQTFRDWRLIVLDHASTDGSVELARQFAQQDPRIVVRECSPELTFSELLNFGLELSDAKYILRQDADDISLPHRMATLAEAFCQMPDISLLGSQGWIINAIGNTTGRFDMPLSRDRIAAIAFFRIPVLHPSAAFRHRDIARHGIRYGEDFIRTVPVADRLTVPSLAEDYFLFGQLALTGKCQNLPQRLLKFRWHNNNISVLKQSEQTKVAINISRYLAKVFANLHDTEPFDPAPFCNHGYKLVDVKDRVDFSDEFLLMKRSLSKGLHRREELQRELDFRKCLIERLPIPIVRKYCAHVVRAGADRSEWYTVKSWMLNESKKRCSWARSHTVVEID